MRNREYFPVWASSSFSRELGNLSSGEAGKTVSRAEYLTHAMLDASSASRLRLPRRMTLAPAYIALLHCR